MKYILLFLSLLILSCSKDDGNPARIASLKVIVVDSTETPVSGAIIATTPATETVTTNSEGVAIINDIPPGDYTINVQILNDPLSYPTPVTIDHAKQKAITIITLPEPDSIEEVELILSAYVNRAYQGMKDFTVYNGRGYLLSWGVIGTDVVFVNSDAYNYGYLELDTYQFTKIITLIEDAWHGHYSVIDIINEGLSRLSKLERKPTEEELNQKAELTFIRALMYFNLTKMFGNPRIFDENNVNDLEAVIPQGGRLAYDLIIKDLLFSKQNLNEFRFNDVVSKEAATALLGKVYLQSAGFPLLINENYNKAIEQFKELEGKFALASEYGSLFDLDSNSENEVIFKIDFVSVGRGGGYGFLWGPIGFAQNDELKLSPATIIDYFDENFVPITPVSFPIQAQDTRFHQNIATFKKENGHILDQENTENWRPYKYSKDLSDPLQLNWEDTNFIILRYADVLLMQAEAINAVSGPNQKAYDLVNQVRRRAYGDDKHDVVAGLDQRAFLEVILNERKKEFFMEGHRKDDLVRTQALERVINDYNQLPDVPYKDYQLHEYIWPIPVHVVNSSPSIEQNPGYTD